MWRFSRALALVVLAGCGGKGDSDSTCFVGGTVVSTPDGPVPIEELRPGDVVLSGTEDGRVVARHVVETLRRDVDHTLVLEVDGRVIESTNEHPFYSLSASDWVRAADLLPGEALLDVDGGAVRLHSVTERSSRVTVHNLTVEGPEHTFFAEGVLVHNKTYPSSGTFSGTGTLPAGSDTTLAFVVDWTDDGYSPTDTDGDGLPDVGCDDSVDITIVDPLNQQVWDFGMAETNSPNGWTGEDCLNGYATFAFCHDVGLSDTLDQVSDCSALSVVAGSTTLLDAEKDPFLTYYFHEGGDCFVFGDDPAYYATLACVNL